MHCPITPQPHLAQRDPNAIHARLIGSDECRAEGYIYKSSSPVLGLCRLLVSVGFDPTCGMEAYRGSILCLKIRSIGEAARLEINGHGSGFCAFPERRTAPPVRKSHPSLSQLPRHTFFGARP
jgi:hypothetical protein